MRGHIMAPVTSQGKIHEHFLCNPHTNAIIWQKESNGVLGMPESDDQQDIQKAQNGNLQAFEALIRRHEARVFSFLVRWLENRTLAEDALQEAAVRAFKNLHRFELGRDFRPWFMRIAVNEAKSLTRSQRRVRDKEDRWRREQSSKWHVSNVTGPVRARNLLEMGLAALSADDRRLLLLRFSEELSIKDIAVVLGTPSVVLKMRIHRAQKRFRDALHAAEKKALA